MFQVPIHFPKKVPVQEESRSTHSWKEFFQQREPVVTLSNLREERK